MGVGQRRKYALVHRHGQDPHPLGDAQRRCVRRRDTEDGMVKIEAVLHPEEAELVWTMINHAATELTCEPAPSAIDDSAEAGAAAQGPRDPSLAGVADLGWPRIRAVNESLAIDADTIAREWDGR